MNTASVTVSQINSARNIFDAGAISTLLDRGVNMAPEVAYTPKVSTQADIVNRTTDIPRGEGGLINTDAQFQTGVLNAIYSGRGAVINVIG